MQSQAPGSPECTEMPLADSLAPSSAWMAVAGVRLARSPGEPSDGNPREVGVADPGYPMSGQADRGDIVGGNAQR